MSKNQHQPKVEKNQHGAPSPSKAGEGLSLRQRMSAGAMPTLAWACLCATGLPNGRGRDDEKLGDGDFRRDSMATTSVAMAPNEGDLLVGLPNSKLQFAWVRMLVWFYLGWCYYLARQAEPEVINKPPVRCVCGGQMQLTAITDGDGRCPTTIRCRISIRAEPNRAEPNRAAPRHHDSNRSHAHLAYATPLASSRTSRATAITNRQDRPTRPTRAGLCAFKTMQ